MKYEYAMWCSLLKISETENRPVAQESIAISKKDRTSCEKTSKHTNTYAERERERERV